MIHLCLIAGNRPIARPFHSDKYNGTLNIAGLSAHGQRNQLMFFFSHNNCYYYYYYFALNVRMRTIKNDNYEIFWFWWGWLNQFCKYIENILPAFISIEHFRTGKMQELLDKMQWKVSKNNLWNAQSKAIRAFWRRKKSGWTKFNWMDKFHLWFLIGLVESNNERNRESNDINTNWLILLKFSIDRIWQRRGNRYARVGIYL